MEKVSVVIPTYNRADKIVRSIQSVLDQTYTNIEVLVVDDASTDHTRNVVQSIKDDRVRYIRLEQNSGASAARNEGVKYADTEWIAFHDSDDTWRKDKLQKQVEYWKKHPNCELIYTSYVLHRDCGGDVTVPFADTIGVLEGNMYETLLQNNTIGAPTILMKKEAFDAVGGFDTTWECLEDWDFVLRLSKKYRIGYVNEILLDAYQSVGGISSNAGAFYTCRCRMIAQNKAELVKRGLFDQTVMTLLQKAQNNGVMELVQKMLMQSLLQYQ